MSECVEEEGLFIDQYLKDAGYENTGINRRYVKTLMESYKGERPVRYAAIKEFVDGLIEKQVRLGGGWRGWGKSGRVLIKQLLWVILQTQK